MMLRHDLGQRPGDAFVAFKIEVDRVVRFRRIWWTRAMKPLFPVTSNSSLSAISAP